MHKKTPNGAMRDTTNDTDDIINAILLLIINHLQSFIAVQGL